MSSQVEYEGKKYKLLPFSFIDKIGSAIWNHFEKDHTVVKKMHADRIKYGKRGIFYVDTKKEANEPAFALTDEEIEFLRTSYSKSQEVF